MSGFLSSVQSTGETRLAISPERYTRIDNSSDWAQVERKRKRRDIDNAIQESIIPLKPGSSNEGLPVPRHALGPRASALTATRYTRLGHASMGAHTPRTWTPGGLYGGHARNSPHRLVTESRTWTRQGESRRNRCPPTVPSFAIGCLLICGSQRSSRRAARTCGGGMAYRPRRRLARRERMRASAIGTHARGHHGANDSHRTGHHDPRSARGGHCPGREQTCSWRRKSTCRHGQSSCTALWPCGRQPSSSRGPPRRRGAPSSPPP
jgi:hypothetical protein